ncbi:hypothetical protein AKJ09_04910 [Labilithrix luteola]|uniref:Uncharacterized protein n=1 Tax=Labilithrix luteola TaxID=1391654 RepID=A0A0K1PY02_9BACT|nr:hypothetical protein AKJ09_04910 [Labilithrix luteola]
MRFHAVPQTMPWTGTPDGLDSTCTRNVLLRVDDLSVAR